VILVTETHLYFVECRVRAVKRWHSLLTDCASIVFILLWLFKASQNLRLVMFLLITSVVFAGMLSVFYKCILVTELNDGTQHKAHLLLYLP